MSVEIKVFVTAEHIANAKPCNTQFCPTALALADRFIKGVDIEVTFDPNLPVRVERQPIVYLYYKEKRWRTKLSTRCLEIIRKFDKGLSIEPFSYKIKVPNSILRKINDESMGN